MAFQILINLTITFVWMFLNNSWDFPTFLIGYLLGLAMIYLLRRFIPYPFYFKKVIALVRLFLIFLKELLHSSFIVIGQIIRPRLNIRPGIFAYHTDLKSDWEITTLACLISLTPGTLTLEVSPEGDTLYIHAMDVSDAEQTAVQIRNTFENAIKEVSR